MFVAIDEESKQVFGPFDSDEQGIEWALAYMEKVEGMTFEGGRPTGLAREDFLERQLWNVQEVTFVDTDDTNFEDFTGRTRAQQDARANPDCECCQNNKDDPEHYHTDVCSLDYVSPRSALGRVED